LEARALPKSGRTRFTFPEGLPSDAFLILSRDGEWLDYRTINHQLTRVADSDVEIVRDGDAGSELIGYTYQGEGPNLEFKSQLPSDGDSLRKLARTVAAFANGNGGVIVFGIERDEVTMVGLAADNLIGQRDRLHNSMSSRVTPRPDMTIRLLEHESMHFMVLEVLPGTSRPYGADPQNPRYYVRRGASTVTAQPDELRRIIGATTAPTAVWSILN
jgi:hypothetical protein